MEDRIKVPPQQIEAEQSVLGGILIDNTGLAAAMEILKGDEFYRDSHRLIWNAIVHLFEANEPVDLVTVSTRLMLKGQMEAAGGAVYLAQLLEVVPSAANIEVYSRIVKEKALLRRLLQVSGEITTYCYEGGKTLEEILEFTEQNIFSVTQGRMRSHYHTMNEMAKDAVETIERLGDGQVVTGVPSGFMDLDRLTAGFQPSDLVIVAARPSMGKTALALNMASNAAKQGIPVGVFSLEMSKEQLVMRMLCSEARVDSHKLRTGAVFSQEKASLLDAAGNLAYLPILIDDSAGISPLEVRAKARRMSAEYSVGMIIIDYLQLMQGKRSERREQEISDISRSLKALAKELNIPVIALSQLNRKVEERHNRRPVLSDLRESGAIEQDADLIAFIYRDEVYNPDTPDKGIAEVSIGKQRNGPIGEVKLAYINAYTRFESLARDH